MEQRETEKQQLSATVTHKVVCATTAGAGELWRYYSAENQFERLRGFLELISRFEFESRRCENYIF